MPPKIILSTVPTGLGHIRVTKALAKGLPEESQPVILGIQDETISFLYRTISTNYYLRKTLEFTQSNPTVEKYLTNLFKFAQQFNTAKTEILLQEMINSNPFRKVIIVSTHAFIAQKIQRIIEKKIIENPIFHAVIITDDSPQRFWMVDCDLLIAPSSYTKNRLINLYEKDHDTPPNIQVCPYPINPLFCQKLSPEVLFNKVEQLQPDNPQRARICIPVSGAAVQLDFFKVLIEELICNDTRQECREFTFSVVTREGNYTQSFINYFRENPEVTLHLGANDEQTVDLYDELYQQLNPPAIEITKPSEQCFKALTTPDTIGGPILLLSDPVGRQEYDNLDFLQRHGFLPTYEVHKNLTEALCNNNTERLKNYGEMAKSWRCLRLPSDPYQAAEFIKNAITSGIFLSMQNYTGYTPTEELSANGVNKIWSLVSKYTQPVSA